MKRITISPRAGYRQKVERLGFCFHEGYWKEEVYYEFTLPEVEAIEKATAECYAMCCDAVQHMIDCGTFPLDGMPQGLKDAIVASWENDDLSLYGRFDFAFDGGTPKLLEFNADTPTSLLECSVIQWDWKEELFPSCDQFNGIHEALVQSFRDIHGRYGFGTYYFACCRESLEDEETLQYVLAAAMEAGLDVAELSMEQLLLCGHGFQTPGGDRVGCCFKLYPWEWMMAESPEGCMADTVWIEPLWKSLMSNKLLLCVLSDLFPDSPYILRCAKSPSGMDSYCQKPVFGREGANVRLVSGGRLAGQTGGEYGGGGFVYQELASLPCFGGRYPIVGSWVVGGEAAGMGIREAQSPITDNMSEFIPHIIR